MYKIFIGLFLTLFFACGHVPETRYFRIDYPIEKVEAKKDGAILFVRDFTSSPVYRENRFIYKPSPYEIKFDNYRRWIELPSEMLTEQAVAHLRASGFFRAVYQHLPNTRDFYALKAQVTAFEEINQPGKHVARVALWIDIEDNKNKKIVWSGPLQEEVVINGGEESILRAMSEATRKVFDDIVAVFESL